MFESLRNAIPEIPIFYFVIIIFFGPILVFMLYNIGIQHLISIPKEIINKRRRLNEEKETLAARRLKKVGHVKKPARRPKGRTPLQYLGQALIYALFATPLAYFSSGPQYDLRAADTGQIKLSLSIPGEHKKKCHKRTRKELMKLPPNMRAPRKCPRARWPVALRLTFDGKVIYEGQEKPSGLSEDGNSSFYQKFNLPSGKHRLQVGMRTRGDARTFTHTLDQEVDLKAGQVLVVTFQQKGHRLIIK